MTEDDVWHALTELLRCAPDEFERRKMLDEAVRAALTQSMLREKTLEPELPRPRSPRQPSARCRSSFLKSPLACRGCTAGPPCACLKESWALGQKRCTAN